jgi:hypothetical protein
MRVICRLMIALISRASGVSETGSSSKALLIAYTLAI